MVSRAPREDTKIRKADGTKSQLIVIPLGNGTKVPVTPSKTYGTQLRVGIKMENIMTEVVIVKMEYGIELLDQ